jgi:hypothetical protein
MKPITVKLLKACTLSIALAGSAALVLSTAMPMPAFADSDKGGGGGKGEGSGKGGSGKSEKVGGGGTTKADKAVTKTAMTTKTKKAKKVSLADELGLSPSDLGALNAAHASPNALKNAAPNSRVGKIVAYRDAVVAGRELEAELEAKKADLESLEPPTRSIAEIDTDVDAAAVDLAEKQATVTQLEAELEAAGGSDPDIEAELEVARVSVADAEATKATLDAELAAAVEYETLTSEVAELEQQVEDQPEVERALLEAAANKPVTDEVEAEVQRLLGL